MTRDADGLNIRAPGYVQPVMRVCLFVLGFIVLARHPVVACIEHPEATKLIGWSADGTAALFVRIGKNGTLEHAEIHPTRYEGFKYLIAEQAGSILIKKVPIARCNALRTADNQQRVAGKLTEASLMKLSLVEKLAIAPLPAGDGGASKLDAAFVPGKRYAEHQVEIREGTKVVATLPVPVWCVGSCLRDEAYDRWSASVRFVAKAGDRTLYVVRMTGVCNAANDTELWMDRVIAVPGQETIPRTRCRGAGE